MKRSRGEMETESPAVAALGPNDVVDANVVKSLLSNLDRCITRNENDRLKHEGNPAQYVDSEVELHASIQELHSLAASPQFFPVMADHAKGRILGRFIQLLSHANATIAAGLLTLLAEMSEVNENVPKDVPYILDFVRELLQRNVLDLVIDACNTFEWKQEPSSDLVSFDDDTEKGVAAALQLLENIMDIYKNDLEEAGGHDGLSQKSIAHGDAIKNSVMGLMDTLSMMLRKVGGFHFLKLHASEDLSSLLSLDVEAGKSVASRVSEKKEKVKEILDRLLQSQAGYRKKVPASAEEEEFYLNLTLCISTFCKDEDVCKTTLVDLQGIDLQLLILKEYKSSVCAQGALQVLRYASSGDAQAVGVAAVEGGALKHAWPFLMGSRELNLKGPERDTILEHAVIFSSNLVNSLHSCTQADICYRLAAKFKEGGSKKLRRVCALFARYHSRVRQAELELEERVQAQREQVEQVQLAVGDVSSANGASVQLLDSEERKLEMLENDEVQYASRLESGLGILQHLATLACFGVLTDPSHLPIAEEVLDVSAVISTIREMCAFLSAEEQKRKDLVGWLAKLQSLSRK